MTRRLYLPLLLLLLAALPALAFAATPAVTPAATPAATPDSTAAEPTVEESTLTAVGQPAPAFTVTTLGGAPFALEQQRGKVVLVNWFATWCPPCRAEMPALKSRVWERFATDPRFVMISVSRAEDAAKVRTFVTERELPWTFGLDTERKAYALYADAYIPRNYVIGPDGRILFQSSDFKEEEFGALVEAIAGALSRAGTGAD